MPVFVLRSLLTECAPNLSVRAREIQEHWSDELRLRIGLDGDRLLTDTVGKLALREWNTMPWTAEALNAASNALEVAISQLEYRTDRGRGPAGDPFLQSNLDYDQLKVATIGQLGESLWPTLVDVDTRAELARIAESDDDERRMREPARRILERVDQ